MTNNVEHLRTWIIVCLVLTSIASTTIPLMYAFFPWRTRMIGRLFMLQALSYALVLDTRVILWIWPNNKVLNYWINAITLTLVTGTTIAMAWWFMTKILLVRKDDEDASQQ